jgi:hypothetical protein
MELPSTVQGSSPLKRRAGAGESSESDNIRPGKAARQARIRRTSRDLEDVCISALGDDVALKAAFDAADSDQSGYIDQYELKKALLKAGRDASDEMVANQMRELDQDLDGFLNFDEFKKCAWATLRDRPKSPPRERTTVDAAREMVEQETKNQPIWQAAASIPEI